MNPTAVIVTVGHAFKASPEGWLVILLVVLPVWAAAMIVLVRGRLRLRSERRAAETCAVMIRRLVRTGNQVTEQALRDSMKAAPPDSVVRRIVFGVWDSRHLASPDLEAMATVAAQADVALLPFARSAPAVLLLAGLMGTVFGLAAVVGKAGPALQAAFQTVTPDSGLAAGQLIGGMLVDMQGAFACTLWGIATAMTVSLLTSAGSREQNRVLALALDVAINRLAPVVFPPSSEGQLDALQQALHSAHGFLQRLPAVMVGAAAEFREVLQTAGNAMSVSLQELRDVSRSMQTSLSEVAGQVRGSADHLRETVSAVQGSADRLRTYHDDLSRAYEDLRKLFDQSWQKLDEQGRAQLAAIGSLKDEFRDSASSILGGTELAATRLAEATAAIGATQLAFREAGDRIAVHVDHALANQTDTMRDAVTAFRQVIVETENSLRRVQQALSDLMERLDPRMLPADQWQAVTDSLGGATAAIKQISDVLRDGHRAGGAPASGATVGIGVLTDSVVQLQSGMTRLQESIVHLTDTVASAPSGTPGPLAQSHLQAITAKLDESNTLLRGLKPPVTGPARTRLRLPWPFRRR